MSDSLIFLTSKKIFGDGNLFLNIFGIGLIFFEIATKLGKVLEIQQESPSARIVSQSMGLRATGKHDICDKRVTV